MNNCTDILPINGCFKPTDGRPSVPVIIHVIYDKDKIAVGQSYTLASDNESPIDPLTYLGGGVVEAGECGINNTSPNWYIGDKGYFLGTGVYNNGELIRWDIVQGNAPSNINAVANSEYPYSFTGTTTSGQTLDTFLNANSTFFEANKVLSLTILVEDLVNDFVYSTRGISKTVLKANQLRHITFGEGQNYPIFEKFFGEFQLLSNTEVTINWEQGEI